MTAQVIDLAKRRAELRKEVKRDPKTALESLSMWDYFDPRRHNPVTLEPDPYTRQEYLDRKWKRLYKAHPPVKEKGITEKYYIHIGVAEDEDGWVAKVLGGMRLPAHFAHTMEEAVRLAQLNVIVEEAVFHGTDDMEMEQGFFSSFHFQFRVIHLSAEDFKRATGESYDVHGLETDNRVLDQIGRLFFD